MIGSTDENLRSLRERANAGMTRDAPSECAHAREALLQRYRDRLIDFGHFDLEGRLARGEAFGIGDFDGIEWIAQLAAIGHVPAAALLHRTLDERRLGELFVADPGRFQACAQKIERFADWLALSESRRPQPDPRVLGEWLRRGSAPSNAIAAVLAALQELAIAPSSGDLQQVTWAIQRHFASTRVNPRLVAELLTLMAESRLVSASREEQAAGVALLKKAGTLAPGSARGWSSLYELSKDSAYMRQWLAKYPTPSSRKPDALIRAALDYETGVADGRPDIEAAITLYGIGLNESPWVAEQNRDLRTEFCLAIARWMFWRFEPGERAAREAALGWLERAIGRGEPAALAMWLRETTVRASAVLRDPEQAFDQAQRFRAAELAGTPRGELVPALEEIIRRAKDLLRAGGEHDAAFAAKWLRIPVLLDHPEAQFLLGALHLNGQGVARNLQTARQLLGVAADQGNEPAKAALARIRAAESPGSRKSGD